MVFNLEDYETVEERIGRLYQNHPDARIVTRLVSPVESVDSIAVFEAEVYLNGDESPKATGYAMEKSGQGYVNKTSHVENCETSAIGRALANMGLHGSKRPSREEMQKAQDKPAEKIDYSRMNPREMNAKDLAAAIKQEAGDNEEWLESARQAWEEKDKGRLATLLEEIRAKRAGASNEGGLF